MSVRLKKMIYNVGLPLTVAINYWSLLKGFTGRDVKGRFAGNMGGMLWALINPLATMLVYMFVFSVVLRVSVTVEETGTDSFFIYFVCGFVPWLIFSDSLIRAMGSILDNASIVTKVIFPVELLPLTSVLSALMINGLGHILLLAYLTFKGFFSVYWLFLFLLLPMQVLFTFGLGMFFSAACVYLRDLREMMGLLLMVWFFATPIIYPLSMVPEHIQSLIKFNPMYMFVSLYRGILILHNLDIELLASAMTMTMLIYVAGSLFFARVKPGFGDVL